MGNCAFCSGKTGALKCRFCGKNFCGEHHAPEKHNCKGIDEFRYLMNKRGVENYGAFSTKEKTLGTFKQ